MYGSQLHWKVRVNADAKIGGFCCDRSVVRERATMLGKLIHRLDDPTAPWDTEEPSPVVEADAVVGFDAVVIGDVIVGRAAYIAAGAIVTRTVAPTSVVVGTTHYTREEWKARKA